MNSLFTSKRITVTLSNILNLTKKKNEEIQSLIKNSNHMVKKITASFKRKRGGCRVVKGKAVFVRSIESKNSNFRIEISRYNGYFWREKIK